MNNTSGGGGGGGLIFVLILVALFVFFVLSTRRRSSAARRLVASVEVGSEVLTGSGLFGRVVDLEADRMRLQIAPGVTVSMLRQAVVRIVTEGPPGGVDLDKDSGPL